MFRKIRHFITHYLDVFYNKYYLPQVIFRRKQQKRLKNTSFSLLTGNCIAGYLYHQLGLKFSSPTINMMIENPDFKKLILNLSYYMQLEPVPCVDPDYPEVPSARLGDIILHFTHYASVEEGINAWNHRKKRLNYDNIYVIITDKYLTYEEILSLSQADVKKIVIMTSKDYGLDSCLYLPAFAGKEHVDGLLGKTIAGKWKFEEFFDFVGWVNSDDKVAQHFYIGN